MPASSEKSQQSVKYPPQPGQGQEAYLAETRSRIGSSIKRAEQAMMAVKSKVLREYDLSVAQYAAMTSLYYVPGQSAAQLARAAAVTPQTMATILARLDAKSLITRVPSEIHSRVNIVTLTDAGEELVVQADEKVRAVERAIARLRERGVIEERDGATWLRTTDFGDDKDRVLIKSDGNAAYFAADLAYYLDKRERGADCAVYLLGADHHGYIGRMMAMCAAFGDTPGTNMQILIGQLVNLVRDGAPVRMSKRAGTIVTLEDLVDAVGVDAARYALARSSMDSMIDIDLDLLASSTSDNPVYYVQYAHARTRNVARNAAEHGVSRDPNEAPFEPGALDDPADAALLGVLAQFPATVAQAAQLREQHRVARYLEQLAAAYHAWYGATRVTPRGDDAVDSGHVARLWLNDAVGQVLANGLDLLGVSAPERM